MSDKITQSNNLSSSLMARDEILRAAVYFRHQATLYAKNSAFHVLYIKSAETAENILSELGVTRIEIL